MSPDVSATRPRDALENEAHLLVVEDDGEMRQLVVKFLHQNGFKVTGVRDAAEMWDAIAATPVDLILLDIMLPGQSGLDLCRALRARSRVPIIMVTARGEETDRIVGLELCADDYLPKPFNRRELLARIRAVLRRAATPPDTESAGRSGRIEFADWSLDTRRRELFAPDGSAVELSGGVYSCSSPSSSIRSACSIVISCSISRATGLPTTLIV